MRPICVLQQDETLRCVASAQIAAERTTNVTSLLNTFSKNSAEEQVVLMKARVHG